MKQVLFLLSALVGPVLCTPGMDRLAALSQIESHNNDQAIGRQREVSRYQILPAYWKAANVAWHPTDPTTARSVVTWIMEARCDEFAARYHRPPDDFEYYILWHRPACLVGRTVPRHISMAERERGRRFANLCHSQG
jgi:hypothetical protein